MFVLKLCPKITWKLKKSKSRDAFRGIPSNFRVTFLSSNSKIFLSNLTQPSSTNLTSFSIFALFQIVLVCKMWFQIKSVICNVLQNHKHPFKKRSIFIKEKLCSECVFVFEFAQIIPHPCSDLAVSIEWETFDWYSSTLLWRINFTAATLECTHWKSCSVQKQGVSIKIHK